MTATEVRHLAGTDAFAVEVESHLRALMREHERIEPYSPPTYLHHWIKLRASEPAPEA